jgi:hypothetical protein
MKKTILTVACLLLFGANMQAQVKIGENAEPAKGALLDLNGTYKGGLLLPNVAITDLGVIPAGFTERGGSDTAADLTGMIVWSTDPVNAGLYMWDGDNWQSLMCQGAVAPCTGTAPAPTAISIPAGPFANGEAFEVSCTATEDGTTIYIWTVPAGLSITTGTGTKTIRVSGTTNTYNKSEFTVFAVNPCGTSAAVNGGTGTIVVNAALSTTPPPSTDIEIPSGDNTGLDGGTVSGGNCANYDYQWQVFNSPNWEDIPGATNEIYQTPALTADTQYRRIATCGSETVTSPTITVTIKQVEEPTNVTAANTTICNGASTTLSYTGGSGTTFVWYSGSCGGTQVGTGNNLSVSPTTNTDYFGRWESGSSVSDCKPVTVTVNTVPAQPGNINLSPNPVNQGATFTASIGAVSGATSYVWTLPAGLTGSSTGRSITITAVNAGNYAAGSIRVAAKNGACTGNATANAVALVVRAPYQASSSCYSSAIGSCACPSGYARFGYQDGSAYRNVAAVQALFSRSDPWFCCGGDVTSWFYVDGRWEQQSVNRLGRLLCVGQ